MKKIMLAMILCIGMTGCMDATLSQYGAIGSPHKIVLWSGGKEAKIWYSTGKVLTEKETDGWFFTDRATGKLVRLSGTVSIEQQ